MIGTEEAWALERAAREDRRRRRGRVRRGDRLRLRAPRRRGAAVRGARPRAADRGRRHLQARRARPQEAGHADLHENVRGERESRRETSVTLHLRRRAAARSTTSSSPPAAGPTSRASGSTRRASSSTTAAWSRSTARCARRAEGVYAIGDLVPGPALAHKASDEGIIAVEDAAGIETHPLAYVDIPRATFCTPNVASLRPDRGAGARGRATTSSSARCPTARSARAPSTATAPASSRSSATSSYGELLGGHIVGAKATELIQELVNARALEGGYPEVARIVHGHPTLSRGASWRPRAPPTAG